jgi:pimeloyl-ACP methyl ester carboxylesterase
MLRYMPAVFVHGNPETAQVWNDLRSRLSRSDHTALSLPGFGCPRPDGFGATKDDYVAWLVAELERLGEPVDLVGHDWGGSLTVRLASLRSDLLRSWTSDSLSAFDERRQWHELARIWQTAGDGEAWVERTLATPVAERADGLERLGVPGPTAVDAASWFDERMGESMLALYRSAVEIAADWSPALECIRAPGLAILATADPFANEEYFRSVARSVRAPIVELEGLGHWWMLQEPRRGAGVLEDFWGSLDPPARASHPAAEDVG